MNWLNRGLLLCSMFICLGCAARREIPLGTIPPPILPTAEERGTALSAVRSHVQEGGYEEIRSGPEYTRVSEIVHRLLNAAGYAPQHFDLSLVDAGDEVNAMAVNSAAIVVYRKLLDRVKSDDELAVVLSHEVAHILARHSQDTGKEERASIVDVGSSLLGAAASVAAIMSGNPQLADTAGDLTTSTTGIIGYGALVGQFDRDQEYEADHVGLMLMAKAGYDPQVALGFWGRAEEVFGDSNSAIGSFFSTHPSFGNREDAIREALPFAVAVYKPRPMNKHRVEPIITRQTKPSPPSDETALYAEIERGYLSRGLDPASTAGIVANLKQALQGAPSEVRRKTLEDTAEQLR